MERSTKRRKRYKRSKRSKCYIDDRLDVAINNFSLYKVKALLRNGASPNKLDDNGNPPLLIVLRQWHQCVSNRYSPIRNYYDALLMLKDLLDHGADPNMSISHSDFQSQITICEYALHIGSIHALSMLLSYNGVVTDRMVRYCMDSYSGPHYEYTISLLSDYTDKIEKERNGWCKYIINDNI